MEKEDVYEKAMEFRLVRRAKSSGGDRYEHGQEKTEEWMVIYIPQSISRVNGEPAPKLTVTIKM